MKGERIDDEFGIIIACYRGDYSLAKACCASIRAHQPDVPICLIIHGDFSIDELKSQYGVISLYPSDVSAELLVSYGYGLTKMIAFWCSPFKRFMYVDPDAVWWGDVLKGIPWREYDIIYNQPHELITPHIQRTQYFDPEALFRHVPSFPWQGQPYFNTGCFTARRGILDLREYLSLLNLQARDPSMLFTDQGILNYMVFKRLYDKKITARSWPLQAVVPVVPESELRSRFKFRRGEPILKDADRVVIHWAGPKPYLIRERAFTRPMSFYRMQHLRNLRSRRRLFGRLALIYEEIRTRLEISYRGSLLRYVFAKLRRFPFGGISPKFGS